MSQSQDSEKVLFAADFYRLVLKASQDCCVLHSFMRWLVQYKYRDREEAQENKLYHTAVLDAGSTVQHATW